MPNPLRIAYLVLCHADAKHIGRLSKRLTEGWPSNRVFVHVDAKSTERQAICEEVECVSGAICTNESVDVWWGGYSAVEATFKLLNAAASSGPFDRYVLLQGADYPIKSNREIQEYFQNHPETEFMRAANTARAASKYVYSKGRYILLFDRPNFCKRVWNKATRMLDLRLRSGCVQVLGRVWDIHWGCAQWAITHECARYLLQFQSNTRLRRTFRTVFPADETFFHTVVYNSHFRERTALQQSERDEPRGLTDLLNLVYFEYPKQVRVFDESSIDYLVGRKELFVRKVSTERSTTLLDELDRRAYASEAIKW